MHAVLFVIVNGFFVGQWLLVQDVSLEDVDRRVLGSFPPGWLSGHHRHRQHLGDVNTRTLTSFVPCSS